MATSILRRNTPSPSTFHDDNAFHFQLLQAIRKVYPEYIFDIYIDHIYCK